MAAVIHTHFIRTNSGLDVDLHNPTPDMLSIRDIAHHLSLINRFSGATEAPYSVAQHSVLVADLLLARKHTAATCMWGLLHDAHEAFLGDMTTPEQFALFGERAESPRFLQERRFDVALADKLFITLDHAVVNAVYEADCVALATEWRSLMPGPCPNPHIRPDPQPVRPLPWHRAHDLFTKTYNTLARHLSLPEA